MHTHQVTLEIDTRGHGFVDITALVGSAVAAAGVQTGICTCFIQHTSAGLLIQENADPSVRRDLMRWLEELAPESRNWEHADEGPDDMPAHVKALLTRTSETIPVSGGRLGLGTWQGLYLVEFRSRPHRRRVVVTVFGAASS